MVSDPQRYIAQSLHRDPIPGVALSTSQTQALGAYIALLQQWNQVYNLTAVSDLEAQLRVHVQDSLSVGPHLQGKRFMDVGTGAGFPGIPLAIAYPDHTWILCEKTEKKVAFLRHVVMHLGLKNRVQIWHGRIETMPRSRDTMGPQGVDGAVCRAFSSLADFVDKTHGLVHSQGRWYAMKAQSDPAERAALQERRWHVETRDLTVPGCHHRHLVIMHPEGLGEQGEITP